MITPHDTELNNRVKKAWTKCGTFRDEFSDKNVPLDLRLKLFDAVLTPTVLFGCSSWAMTNARDEKIRSTQLKVLRCMLGRKGMIDLRTQVVETWVEWVQRVTREVRQTMVAHGLADWVEEQRRRVRKWSEQLERMTERRWNRKVLDWRPEGRRSRGHPCARWTDNLHR